MNSEDRGRNGSVWFWVSVALFLAAVVYIVVSVLTGSSILNARDDAPLYLLGLVGAISLAGWWRARAGRNESEEEARRERERLEGEVERLEASVSEARQGRDEAREQEEAHRQERRRLEERSEKREGELSRERYLRMRSERAYQAEKDWRQHLHSEVMRLSREHGTLGNPKDVPSLVLRLARTLVGAQKGLILSRQDESKDAALSLIAAEGFEHDPGDSAVVRRLASEVIERNRTLREENPSEGQDGEVSAADEEIENLVAIPIYVQDEFDGVVVCTNNPGGFDEYDDELLVAVGDHVGTVLENARLHGELRSAYLATIGVLVGAIEVKDPFIRQHSEEVSGYVEGVADRLDLPPDRREELVFGSLLHDVGKIGVSERILLKPTALTPEERAVVELHPRIGYHLIRQVPALSPIAPAILHHHERFDGTGYPSGLRGEQIPMEARVISVADSFSAMVSERPYREPLTPEEACAELERCAGTQFDAGVVRVFVEEVRQNPPAFEAAPMAVGDPELDVRRSDGEPVLGQGTLALIDNLTLLHTRRYLHEAARAEAESAEVKDRPFSVVLVELGGIPQINRLQGYAAGDEAIRRAARAIQEVASRRGATACRYGGNRLGLVIPDADEASTDLLGAEISDVLDREAGARVAAATWRPHDDGDAVIARARDGLADASGTPA